MVEYFKINTMYFKTFPHNIDYVCRLCPHNIDYVTGVFFFGIEQNECPSALYA